MPTTEPIIHIVTEEHAIQRGRNWSDSRCGRALLWDRLALTVEAAKINGRVCQTCMRAYCAQKPQKTKKPKKGPTSTKTKA